MARNAESNAIESSGGATALAPRQSAMPASRLEGAEQADFVLPRIHVYQGLPTEAREYGKGFDPGDLINTLTNEKITAKNFVPILGYKQFIRWKEPRGSGLEYSHRNKADVPPEDLEWQDNVPPAAQEYINWVVLFEGHDTPVVLAFTKTSLGSGRAINTCEGLRGRKGPGLYTLEMQEKSNDKGAWVSPRVRPLGDPPADMTDLVTTIFQSMSGAEIKTSDDPDAGGDGFDPDAE